MNGHPENDAQDELDLRATEYDLGSLGAGPRPEVEHHLNHDAELLAAIDAWEQHPPAPTPDQLPSPGLWPRLKRWWHHHS